ncbi:NAD(+) ADP-ribosyltransferase [Bertholletia excelsa]
METAKAAHQCRLFSAPFGITEGHVNGFRGLVSDDIRTHSITIENRFKHSSTSTDSSSGTQSDHEPSISDSESGISVPNSQKSGLFGEGLVRLDEGDRLHEIIKRRFISGLDNFGVHATVVAVHRNLCSGIMGEARLRAFHVFAQAMEKKYGGSANLKYAWYGASREEIEKIITYGFSHCGKDDNKGIYGCGIYLSPDDSSINSVKSSIVDEDGLRHVLLCRVILGNTELVHPGSKQCHPSSEEFDSGVDNLLAPKKYIVWNTHMNTHILPEYVISFRAPIFEGGQKIQDQLRKPASPWIPFPTLISVLSRFLPPHTIRLISKYYNDHGVSIWS